MKGLMLSSLVPAASAAAAWTRLETQGAAHGWVRGPVVGTGKDSPEVDHELIFAIPQLNLDRIERTINEVSDPAHANYGRHLSFDEVGRLVENKKSLAAVRQWLVAEGVEGEQCAATVHGEYLRCTAPTATWGRILNTEFRMYFPRDGASSAVAVRAPHYSVPPTVAEHLDAVFLATHLPPARNVVEGRKAPQLGAAAAGYCTPDLLNKAYNITSNDGMGRGSQSVFETGGQNYSPDDLAQFQAQYGVAVEPVAVDVGGGNDSDTCKFLPWQCGEANLDIQYEMAVAQHVPTWFWNTDKTYTFAHWIADVANTTDMPLVHSISYGQLEAEAPPTCKDSFTTEAMKLGVRGVTILASTGDDGVAGVKVRKSPGLCAYNPQWPASCPYVTAVGATQGPEEFMPEVACASTNNNTFITSGGGFSDYFTMPDYQTKAVTAFINNGTHALGPGFNAKGRAYPDVSLIGHLYPIIVGGEVNIKDGTSASTPVFAALISLVNSRRLAAGKAPVGFANPALYNWQGTDIFNDIVEGKNNCCAGGWEGSTVVCCPEHGFYSAPGWDAATGLGSVNAGLLIDAWAGL